MRVATLAPRPDELGLSTERAVARRLVHKLAIEETFVTGVQEVPGGEAYIALAQLPRANRLYNDTLQPYYDLLLVAEVARQGVMVVLHECVGVPFDSHFVTARLDVALKELEPNRVAPLPTEMAITVGFSSRRTRRDGTLRRIEGAARCHIAGIHSATFEGCLLFAPRRTYASLRDGADSSGDSRPRTRLAPADPREVGRSNPRNVVVTSPEPHDGGFRAYVTADRQDAVFFDHPQDHYPGMLLLEAARQTAVASASQVTGEPGGRLVPRRCTAGFSSFAELDEPLECLADVGARSGDEIPVGIAVEQGGDRVSSLAVTLLVHGQEKP